MTAATVWVWIRNPITGGTARVSQAALAQYEAAGWILMDGPPSTAPAPAPAAAAGTAVKAEPRGGLSAGSTENTEE